MMSNSSQQPVSSFDRFSISSDSLLVFDVSDRTQIELTGADRAKFLHGFCTNDIKRLTPGSGCEAFLTNIKGKIVGHIFVFAGENSLWLDAVGNQSDFIVSHLDRYLIREDVQFVTHQDLGELFVTGLHAAQLLMLDDGISAYGCVTRELMGHPFQIRRVDLFEQPGFLISIPRASLGVMRGSLTSIGCITGSKDLFESLRVASGFPQFGRDITEDNLAQEVARTSQCISFTKGCYLGQEPIARLDALGHTNRELRRIEFPPAVELSAGMKMISSETDDEAGVVTSVSPLLTNAGTKLALGYLKTKYNKVGTQIRIDGGDMSQSSGKSVVGTVF